MEAVRFNNVSLFLKASLHQHVPTAGLGSALQRPFGRIVPREFCLPGLGRIRRASPSGSQVSVQRRWSCFDRRIIFLNRKFGVRRLSFPSGHASFSAYTMVYLALYLQARMTWSGSRLLRPFLQLSALMLTWYTGLSRVSDYKHHWSDVLAGFLIGTVAASLTVRSPPFPQPLPLVGLFFNLLYYSHHWFPPHSGRKEGRFVHA